MFAAPSQLSFIPSEKDVELAQETKQILTPHLSAISPMNLRHPA
jgi:hypothetical protein